MEESRTRGCNFKVREAKFLGDVGGMSFTEGAWNVLLRMVVV